MSPVREWEEGEKPIEDDDASSSLCFSNAFNQANAQNLAPFPTVSSPAPPDPLLSGGTSSTNPAGQLHLLEDGRRRCNVEVEQRRDWSVDCSVLFEAGRRQGEE